MSLTFLSASGFLLVMGIKIKPPSPIASPPYLSKTQYLLQIINYWCRIHIVAIKRNQTLGIICIMKEVITFTATIRQSDGGGAFVRVPFDIKDMFGKGRLKVNASFDGEPYSGSIVNMGVKNEDGSICYILGILKSIRKKLNKDIGDTVLVKIEAF